MEANQVIISDDGRPVKRSSEQDEDLLRIFRYLVEQGAEKDTVSSVAKVPMSALYKDLPIWELFGKYYR